MEAQYSINSVCYLEDEARRQRREAKKEYRSARRLLRIANHRTTKPEMAEKFQGYAQRGRERARSYNARARRYEAQVAERLAGE